MGIPFPQFEEGSRVVSYVLRWLEWPEWLLAFGIKDLAGATTIFAVATVATRSVVSGHLPDLIT